MRAPLVLLLLSLFSVITAQNQATITVPPNPYYGVIVAPTPGAKIKPKQKFDFSYKTHQGYCLSSHNITVMLLTSPPTSTSNAGHYFGRFRTGNYPGVPGYPQPTGFTMPDFSLSPGGMGAGLVASNLPVWITVTEEWNDCTPMIGNTLYVTNVLAIYNATN